MSIRHMLVKIYKALLKDGLQNNKLQLLTPAGVVCGNIEPNHDDIGQCIMEKKNEAINDCQTEQKNTQVVLTESFITLYDAVLIQGNSQVRFYSIDIIIDDIIGITIGNI